MRPSRAARSHLSAGAFLFVLWSFVRYKISHPASNPPTGVPPLAPNAWRRRLLKHVPPVSHLRLILPRDC
jgi:hypothetical protein